MNQMGKKAMLGVCWELNGQGSFHFNSTLKVCLGHSSAVPREVEAHTCISVVVIPRSIR